MNLESILTSDNVVDSIKDNLDYLLSIIPELEPLIGYDQMHIEHSYDVFDHTLFALSLSDNNFVIRLVLLLHDISKPTCFQIKANGQKSYHGHNRESAKIAHNILTRLGYQEEFIDYICYFIENHDYPISNKLIENDIESAKILYHIQECDALAHNYDYLDHRLNYLDYMYKRIKKSV